MKDAVGTEEVVLVVGGREFAYWTNYSVKSDLLIPADDFQFSAATPTRERRARIEPGAACSLYVNKQKVLVGYIDEVQSGTETGAGTVTTVSGRDLACRLVDASASKYSAIEGVTLTQLAQELCAPFGITAISWSDSGGDDSADPFGFGAGKQKPNPGETPWQILERYAEKLGLMLWFDAGGTLNVAKPHVDKPPSFHFRQFASGVNTALNNVKSLVNNLSIAGVFSEYVVLGQDQGDDEFNAQAASEIRFTERDDSGLLPTGFYKPLILQDSEANSVGAAQRRALKEKRNRQRDGQILTIRVPGHSQAGIIYRIDEVCYVCSEIEGIDEDYFITSVEFTRSKEAGTETTLTCRTCESMRLD